MGDWDQSDLISLSPSMYPPEFMWVGGEGDNGLEKKMAVIQKHYNSFAEILDGGAGYETLTTMMERLEDHLSKAGEEAAPLKSRREYHRLRHLGVKRELKKIAQEKSDTEEQMQKKEDRLLDEPIGAHWSYEDGTPKRRHSTEEWAISITGTVPSNDAPEDNNSVENPGATQYGMSIQYRPVSGKYGAEFNEDHIQTSDKIIFNGNDTWREVLESTRKKYTRIEEIHERARRTVKLLRFRLRVIETVLYRFEVHGSVGKMTEEQVRETISEQDEEGPLISGYRGPEYAVEAKEILEETTVTTFSALEREMEETTVAGESKVDTIKRNIGYADLPKEEKDFARFREMVARKVTQLEGED